MSIGRWKRAGWLSGAVLAVAVGAAAVAATTPAQAAVPDHLGFVLYNGSAVVPSGTVPPATTVVPGLPGQYKVTIPGMGVKGGVVHVTAINPKPHWCQTEKFAPSGIDEVVVIGCYLPGGVPDKTAFSLVYGRLAGAVAGGGAYGYVDAQPTGALVSQYNSAGALNAVAHTGVGQWTVKLPGLATPGPQAGSLQATAVNPSIPARCKVGKWASGAVGQTVSVWCFNAGGAPFDTRFHLTYQYQRPLYAVTFPPKHFGYLWYRPPLGPVPTNFNSIAGPGANTATPAGTGLTLLTFKSLGAQPDGVQVTAFGGKNEFCDLLMNWVISGGVTVLVRDVACFTNAGAPITTGFLAAYSSRV